MSKPVTREDWFNLLPEDVREKAYANLEREEGKEEMKDYLKMHQNHMSEALMGAFIFELSNEGLKYWLEILEDYPDKD